MDPIKKNNLTIIIVAATIIVALAIAVFYFIHKANEKEREMTEVVQMMNFDKEQVQKEFSDLNSEMDGYTTNIHNDSLVKLLQNQKTKVSQLLDELRVTKSTNSVRIAQLRAELSTVRKVMIQDVNQIDSLNSMNKSLKTENVEVHKKYQAASESVEALSKEKESLNQVVTRASIMEVTNFSMTPVNSKGKKTGWFSQTTSLQFNYTVAKNITAQPGEKIVYLRVTRTDEDVLTKNPSNVFSYESKDIVYSVAKKIEYAGDAINDVMFWKIGEILPKGNYRAEFFIDGNRVGSFKFLFEK